MVKRPRHIGKSFVKDGIIDRARWVDAQLWVLFLLKEAYDDPGAPDWGLRAAIRKTGTKRKEEFGDSVDWILRGEHRLPRPKQSSSENRAHIDKTKDVLRASAALLRASSSHLRSYDHMVSAGLRKVCVKCAHSLA